MQFRSISRDFPSASHFIIKELLTLLCLFVCVVIKILHEIGWHISWVQLLMMVGQLAIFDGRQMPMPLMPYPSYASGFMHYRPCG